MADVNLNFSGLQQLPAEALQSGLEKEQDLAGTLFDSIKSGAKKLEETRVDSFEKVRDANLQQYINQIEKLSDEELVKAKVGEGKLSLEGLDDSPLGRAGLGRGGYQAGVATLQERLEKERKSRIGEQADIAQLETNIEDTANQKILNAFTKNYDLSQKTSGFNLDKKVRQIAKDLSLPVNARTQQFVQQAINDTRGTSEFRTDQDNIDLKLHQGKIEATVGKIDSHINEINTAASKGIDIDNAYNPTIDTDDEAVNQLLTMLGTSFGEASKEDAKKEGKNVNLKITTENPLDANETIVKDPEVAVSFAKKTVGLLEDQFGEESEFHQETKKDTQEYLDSRKDQIIKDPRYSVSQEGYQKFRNNNPGLQLPANGIEYGGKTYYPDSEWGITKLSALARMEAENDNNTPIVKDPRFYKEVSLFAKSLEKNALSAGKQFSFEELERNLESELNAGTGTGKRTKLYKRMQKLKEDQFEARMLYNERAIYQRMRDDLNAELQGLNTTLEGVTAFKTSDPNRVRSGNAAVVGDFKSEK